jgi:hypothetical protein
MRTSFPRGPAGFLLLAAGVFPLGACGLFETREPIISTGSESLWVSPTTPQIVVDNLEAAFEASNFTDYARALTQDFVFHADDSDVAQMAIDRPGEMVYDGWTRDVEAQTAEIIRGPVDDLSLSLVAFDEDIVGSDRLLKYQYTLTLTTGTQVDQRSGEAWLLIRQEPSGEWFIYDWEDIASSTTDMSWGLLKGQNRVAAP